MVIGVPLKLFKDRSSVMDPSMADDFREKLSARYPWLSKDAVDVILKEAKRVRKEEIGRERTAIQKARDLISTGRYSEATRMLTKHLRSHPDDSDAWLLKGEALCKMGRSEEGFRAISMGRRSRPGTNDP